MAGPDKEVIIPDDYVLISSNRGLGELERFAKAVLTIGYSTVGQDRNSLSACVSELHLGEGELLVVWSRRKPSLLERQVLQAMWQVSSLAEVDGEVPVEHWVRGGSESYSHVREDHECALVRRS